MLHKVIIDASTVLMLIDSKNFTINEIYGPVLSLLGYDNEELKNQHINLLIPSNIDVVSSKCHK